MSANAFSAMLAQIILSQRLPFSVSLAPEPRPTKRQEHLLDASAQGRVWEETFGDY